MNTWHLDRYAILLWLNVTLSKELSVFILCVICSDFFLSSLFSLAFLYIEQPVLTKYGSVYAVTAKRLLVVILLSKLQRNRSVINNIKIYNSKLDSSNIE
jgi:hypothetical protein